MRRLATVFSREYLSCMMRPATWGVLIAALAFTLLDSLPTDANLARVELLPVPSFFANRIMSVSGLVLVTGLVILLSSRLARDKKAGVKSLLMASPLSKGEYLLGKLLAGFFFSLSLMGLYLTVCMAAYALAIPAASASSMFEYGYVRFCLPGYPCLLLCEHVRGRAACGYGYQSFLPHILCTDTRKCGYRWLGRLGALLPYHLGRPGKAHMAASCFSLP